MWLVFGGWLRFSFFWCSWVGLFLVGGAGVCASLRVGLFLVCGVGVRVASPLVGLFFGVFLPPWVFFPWGLLWFVVLG